MSLDTYRAHARLMERLLSQMDETFAEALKHPNLSESDQVIAAEMRQWIAHGLFLCQQVHSLQGTHLDPDQEPILTALYTLDRQVDEVSEQMRQKDLFRPGAPERVQKMLDAAPTNQ
jgi:hypothetical protein